uniref:TRAM domain-containing protein n=1 Tax=Plectus sambesii TaxID=2011161 RepID=A0A914XH72_9BILA
MICAFPTETAEDFEDSMNLVRKYRFPSLFINQFYPRPGTPAAHMKCIDTVEAKRRTKAMSELFRLYLPYGDDRIGQTYDVLIAERASDGNHLVGHNKAYEQILIPDEPGLIGSMVKVRIVSFVLELHVEK